jgi:ABC-2 type transport system ATP-binding protein
MPIIEVKNLTKKFGDFTAVNDISFSVEHGDVFAFLGPNGAGKTTTIKMLTTLLSPTSGTLKVNDFDLEKDQAEVRKSFGIVFQDHSLDDELTAYENMEFHAVLYGLNKEERTKKIEELFKLVDLWDRRRDYVKNYSGGMKRRLEIARSLVHTPKILFLDEPTLGLDPQTRNHIWTYVINLAKVRGVTVFLTTHYMEEADKMANKVVIIDHGRVIGSGTPEELKKKMGTDTLEGAFLKLTGEHIREDEASTIDSLRVHNKMWTANRSR